MRKYLFFVGAAAMMLASCTSEGVVNPGETPAAGNEVPMLFSSHRANQSRAAMETESYTFGVYGYKTDNTGMATFGNVTETTVMDNYMVGYWNGNGDADKTEGYQPLGGQELTTNWYYEGLGSSETAKYSFHTAKPEKFTKYTSAKETQFLKYWDGGKESTYFFGYAPYGSATVTPAAGETTMTFTMTSEPGDAYMYASAKCKNSEYIDGTGKKVDLDFVHFGSQVRMAFYSDIKGYAVDLIAFNPGDADPIKGVIAVPAKKNADDTYSVGEFYDKADYSVVFTDDAGAIKATPGDIETNYPAVSANLISPIDWFAAENSTTYTTRLGNSYANKIIGPRYNVVPQKACGFTVNVSFKLTATDTGEVLYVYGARVFIEPTYTQWAPNTLYTYVFRVTKKVPGSTADNDPDVLPTPNNDDALYPIVFEQVTVTPMGEGLNGEWDINPGVVPGNHDYNH